MSDTCIIRLWFVRETLEARLYRKIPMDKPAERVDFCWIPKSLIEHTTKNGDEHYVTLPAWFVDKHNL